MLRGYIMKHLRARHRLSWTGTAARLAVLVLAGAGAAGAGHAETRAQVRADLRVDSRVDTRADTHGDTRGGTHGDTRTELREASRKENRDPPGDESLAAPAEVLALLNARRAAGAVCGSETLPPVPALLWHVAMERAATDHLHDIARRPALTHLGSDGSTVGGRVWRQGYVWGGVGENVAGGYRGAADTLQQWLRSPSHCRTLMGAGYRHVAVVGRHFPGSRLGPYWVMVVARPMQ